MRLPIEDVPWDLSCPYCHAGWSIVSGFEAERVIKAHEPCPQAPQGDEAA